MEKDSCDRRYFVYMLRCCDESLYCGIAVDPDIRLERHNAGRGAKYTAAHRPCVLVYAEGPFEKGQALKREAEIKKLSKAAKEALVSAFVLR